MKEASSEESFTTPNETRMARFCRPLGPVSLEALEETNAPKCVGDASYLSEKSQTAPLEGLLGEDPPGSFTMHLLFHPLNRSVVIVQVIITRAILCST